MFKIFFFFIATEWEKKKNEKPQFSDQYVLNIEAQLRPANVTCSNTAITIRIDKLISS